jgi:pyruvate ferredoxin oxidoreductase beta subunit
MGMSKHLFVSGHTACAGCGMTIIVRNVIDALGKDVIVVNATGCLEIVSSAYPRSAWEVPYIHCLFENAPSVATGIVHALRAQGNDHTKVVVFAGDGSTYDIGIGALSGMLERNEDVLYICYDNEAYMNTGNQRSSATPFGAATTTSPAGSEIHGKQQFKKPITEIAASHGIKYAASSGVSYLADLKNKVKKAAAIKGAAFISVHSPCVPGWGYDPALTVDLGKKVVMSGLWKLFEIENGKFKFNFKPEKRIPVAEYFKPQKRFKHLTDEEIANIQKIVDEEWEELERTSE